MGEVVTKGATGFGTPKFHRRARGSGIVGGGAWPKRGGYPAVCADMGMLREKKGETTETGEMESNRERRRERMLQRGKRSASIVRMGKKER